MLKYYPPRMPKISALNKQFPELGAVDYLEEQRYACPPDYELRMLTIALSHVS